MVKLTINGKLVQAAEGEMLLSVIRREKIDIPALCTSRLEKSAFLRKTIRMHDNFSVLSDDLISSCMIPMVMGIHQIFYVMLRERPDYFQNSIRNAFELAVNDEYSFICHKNPDVTTLAIEAIDVPRHVLTVECGFLRRCRLLKCQQDE